jgi:hypothetical protein
MIEWKNSNPNPRKGFPMSTISSVYQIRAYRRHDAGLHGVSPTYFGRGRADEAFEAHDAHDALYYVLERCEDGYRVEVRTTIEYGVLA